MRAAHLKLDMPTPPAPSRGRKLSPEQVRELYFPADMKNRPSVDWVRRTIRPRIKIGRIILFYEQDVEDFLSGHREAS